MVGANSIKVCHVVVGSVDGPGLVLAPERESCVASRERQCPELDACGSDAWECRQPFVDLLERRAYLLRLGSSLLGKTGIKREDSIRIEPRTDIPNAFEAPDHQARADQQHQSQSYFTYDEHGLRPAPSRYSPASLFQCFLVIGSSGLERGHNAEEQPTHDRHGNRKEQNSTVDLNARDRRQYGWKNTQHRDGSPCCKGYARRAAAQRQQCAL